VVSKERPNRLSSTGLDPDPPPLRLEVPEAARMLRMSRSQLFNRMKEGSIKAQKDGSRTYITRAELERYVATCAERSSPSSQTDEPD
jgi:hypothetical protein